MTYLKKATSITLHDLAKMREQNTKIAMLTAYDASFAALCERNGVDCLLIGDSLGNAIQGQKSTLPVTLSQMVYHTECVARAAQRAWIISDLPFATYQVSPAQALESAARLLAAGAHMVKLEGGAYMAETVRFLVERGIPVCAHIGLTPQAVHQLGGYRVQGRGDSGKQLLADALALEEAGAAMLTLEMVPAEVAGEITKNLSSMATIGIGAGKECDGQVLVVYDMLGIYHGKIPRFVKNFMDGARNIDDAVGRYVAAVKNGTFPGKEHCYSDLSVVNQE